MQKATSKNIFSYILILLSIIIIIIISYFITKERNKISQTDLLIAQQKKKYGEINKKNELAKELIEYKKTIISKEREAHSRGYYEEGEKIVVIKGENIEQNIENKTLPKESRKSKKPITMWYNVFFGENK